MVIYDAVVDKSTGPLIPLCLRGGMIDRDILTLLDVLRFCDQMIDRQEFITSVPNVTGSSIPGRTAPVQPGAIIHEIREVRLRVIGIRYGYPIACFILDMDAITDQSAVYLNVGPIRTV